MDHRDRAAREGKWYKKFDERTMTATVEHEDEDGFEVDVEIPCRFEVCGTCEGMGSHVNPSIDGHGITASEWQEWDPEEREDYFSGRYDVACYECGGNRVVPVADDHEDPKQSHLSPEQREAYRAALEERRARGRESYEERHLRRMESGGY